MMDQELRELLRAVLDAENEQTDRLGATARSVTRLAQGLSIAEENRGAENAELTKIKQALVELIAVVSERDPRRMTGDQLADHITLEVASRARQVLWSRKQGLPEPLPPLPVAVAIGSEGEGEQIVPVHTHRRKDDSVAFRTGADGSARLKADIKVKTLLGWIVAGIMGVYEVVKAVKEALGH